MHPWSGKIPHAVEQLSLRTATIEPVLWSPGTTTPEARAPQSPSATRAATAVRGPLTATREWPPLQLEKSPCINKDLAWPPNNNTKKRRWGSNHRKDDAGTGASCGPSVRGGCVLGVPSGHILGVLKDQWIYQEIKWWCATIPMMFLVWGVGRTELPSTERWGSVGGGG